MRKSILLFIILLLATSACTRRPKPTLRSLLQEVEDVVHTAPDSAYYLLQNALAGQTLMEEDSIYYLLLTAEVQLHNQQKLEDTAAMHNLTLYYKEKQDTLMQARAQRLYAVAHRDLGFYDATVQHYNTAIALAQEIGNKRLLADAYFELAHLYTQEGERINSKNLLTLSQNMYSHTEQFSIEIKDTVLWINTLLSQSIFLKTDKRYKEAEHKALLALYLAEKMADKRREAMACFRLSVIYGNLGMNDFKKSFAYSMRSLELKKETISKENYYFSLSLAYRLINQKDSADFYSKKGFAIASKKLNKKYSAPFNWDNTIPLEQRMEQMRQNDIFNNQSSETKNTFLVCIIVISAVVISVFIYFNRRHSYTLKRKEREITQIQEQLDVFASESDVFHKMEQIIHDCLHTSKSSIQMTKSDWEQLILKTRQQYPDTMRYLQDSNKLTYEEIKMCCLHLTEHPVSHLCFLSGYSRASIYRKSKEILEKLNVSETTTLRDFLKDYSAKH